MPGRTLQAPLISYKKPDRKQESRLQPKDASWNLRDIVFYEARRVSTRWSWVVINPFMTHKRFGGDEQACIRRIEEWATNVRAAGIAIDKPTVPGVNVVYGREENPQRNVDAAFESWSSTDSTSFWWYCRVARHFCTTPLSIFVMSSTGSYMLALLRTSLPKGRSIRRECRFEGESETEWNESYCWRKSTRPYQQRENHVGGY